VTDQVLHAMIYDLIVDPGYQRQGLGSQVLDRLVARCQEANIRDIQLFCARGKQAFYEKHGFVIGQPMRLACNIGGRVAMNITMLAVGTRGDVQPAIALARRSKQRDITCAWLPAPISKAGLRGMAWKRPPQV